MSLRSIRHGAIVSCDAIGCATEFVTYSWKMVARKQASRAAWTRVPRWTLRPDEHADRRLVADACPGHTLDAVTRENDLRDLERAIGKISWRALRVVGCISDLLPSHIHVGKKIAAKVPAKVPVYLMLVAPSVAAADLDALAKAFLAGATTKSDILPVTANPSQGPDDHAERAHPEQRKEDQRQDQADQERSSRRRRSAKPRDAEKADGPGVESSGGGEHRGDADAAPRDARGDAHDGNQVTHDASGASDGAADALARGTEETTEIGVQLHPLPAGDNLASGLPVVPVEAPRRMPRARRNKDGPTVLDVIEQILARSAEAEMSVAAIVASATGDLALPTNSKTPHTIVSRDLALDVKNEGDASRFIRTAPGRFTLRARRNRESAQGDSPGQVAAYWDDVAAESIGNDPERKP